MTSYIYFIQAENDGPIKIGFTGRDPRKRMVKIQSDCPWRVKLLGAIEGTVSQEKQIHLLLAMFKTQGEWFEPHPVVLAAVREALNCGKAPSPLNKNDRRTSTHDHPLTRYRNERKMSLRSLADQAGLTCGFLSKVERRIQRPGTGAVVALQRVTGIDFSDLIGGA